MEVLQRCVYTVCWTMSENWRPASNGFVRGLVETLVPNIYIYLYEINLYASNEIKHLCIWDTWHFVHLFLNLLGRLENWLMGSHDGCDLLELDLFWLRVEAYKRVHSTEEQDFGSLPAMYVYPASRPAKCLHLQSI